MTSKPMEIEMTNCGEESEPLNENGRITNMKMEDAPFQDSRAGSEEDFLAYDDDGPIFNCDSCKIKRRLTIAEKCLIGFGVVCLIVIIVLAAQVGKKKDVKDPIRCANPGCLKAAHSVISAMDLSADPCEDFHQYACGGWLKETPIPPGYPIWDRFQELSYKNMYMLKNFIESHTLYGSSQEKVKHFLQSCMDESERTRSQTLTDIRGLLSNISMEEDDYIFIDVLLKIHKLNTWPLFEAVVGPNEKDPDHNIIKMEAGSSPFPYGIFKDEERQLLSERSSNKTEEENSNTTNTDETTKTDKETVKSASGTETNGTEISKERSTLANMTTTKSPSTRKPHIKDTHPHPTHNLSELVKEYLRETSMVLQVLWKKTKEEADKEAELILDLEKKLSLAHDIELHIHNRTQAYNQMSVGDLQSKCDHLFSWKSYLNGLLGTPSRPITDQTQVIVLHEKALQEVCYIVQDYSRNKTAKSLSRRYMLLSLAKSMMRYFDMNTYNPDIDPDEEIEIEGENWRRCTFYTNKAFGLAAGAIYVNATSLDTYMSRVKELVDYVKIAFKQYLLRKIWMDEKTKQHAAGKIDEMIEKVSYPSYILNTTFLDDYYSQFKVGTDWFSNLLNWREFTLNNMVKTLNEEFDRKSHWLNPPVTVESDYSPVRNDIIFPIALFHLPIYSNDGPSALNFGAIGSLIGHEITHAFDIQGRQYDGFGKLRDWWNPVTAQMFNETTKCMKDQYDHYRIDNMTVNGEQTLEENIADNGGLRAANIAYELWTKEHGEEEQLPGVELTNRQIFYISFAQLYCSKWQDYGIRDYLLHDAHSPGPYRIEGALSNSLAFQDVFKCSYVSRYNPSTKCRVW